MQALIIEELAEGHGLPVNIDILICIFGHRVYRFCTFLICLYFSFSLHNRFVYQFELVCSYMDDILLVDLLTTGPGHDEDINRSFHRLDAPVALHILFV